MDNGLTFKLNNRKPRIAVIDSLRGFAIAAIFLIHTSNHFLYNNFPPQSSELDNLLRSLLYFIFENKAYTIFALLFGYTFALQMNHYREREGGDFGGIMLWRMVLLVVIGLWNAMLFAGGDPLIFYALTMMLILPLRNLSTRVLGLIAVLLLLQPVELLNSIFGWYSGTCYYEDYGVLNSIMREGDMLSTFGAGATMGVSGALKWAVVTGRFTQTMGLFLVGIIACRGDLFARGERWSRYYILYILMTVALYFGSIYFFEFLKVYYSLFFVLSFVAIFVRVERAKSRWEIFRWLGDYGRMSLTNFVMQSFFGALLYYPWGLDLGSQLGVSWSVVITLGLIVAQVILSRIWFRYNKRGPLEGLWHRATYLFKL